MKVKQGQTQGKHKTHHGRERDMLSTSPGFLSVGFHVFVVHWPLPNRKTWCGMMMSKMHAAKDRFLTYFSYCCTSHLSASRHCSFLCLLLCVQQGSSLFPSSFHFCWRMFCSALLRTRRVVCFYGKCCTSFNGGGFNSFNLVETEIPDSPGLCLLCLRECEASVHVCWLGLEGNVIISPQWVISQKRRYR